MGAVLIIPRRWPSLATMAWRASLGPVALLLASGCAYAPSFTHGPPFGSALVVEHHDSFPAASEREARFAETRHYGSQRKCEEKLRGIGEVVRLSSFEALVHRTVSHEGRQVTEEHLCARETLRVRAWYLGDGHGETESGRH